MSHQASTTVQHLSGPVAHVVDAVAVPVAVGVFFHLLPDIAGLLSIVWLVIRISVSIQEYRLNQRKFKAHHVVAAVDETAENVK